MITGEEIEATGGHPYWVVDGEDLADRPTYDGLVPTTPEDSTLPGRWVMAIDLRVGDTLWQRDGRQVAVEEISVEFKEETIYNFEVSSQHNYAVGHRGFLVQNTNQRWDKLVTKVRSGYGAFGWGKKPKPLRPERKYTQKGKHGVNWEEGAATAKNLNKPQGQWSQGDLDLAGELSVKLKPREGGWIKLPEDSQSIIHLPNGTPIKATHAWIRNNGSGTFHGYPGIKPPNMPTIN